MTTIPSIAHTKLPLHYDDDSFRWLAAPLQSSFEGMVAKCVLFLPKGTANIPTPTHPVK
jgi:hypothetical protein